MKIRVLQAADQDLSSHLVNMYRIDTGYLPEKKTVVCCQLQECETSQIQLIKSLPFSIQISEYEPGSFIYLFDQIKLIRFFQQHKNDDLGIEYRFINELRLKSEALFYNYPESKSQYGLDLSIPRVMGILNITPDSFSDGGNFINPEKALDHALAMIDKGADIIDLGGESSRPGAQPVNESEEINRILPVIKKIRAHSDIILSVDTYKAAVARQALEAGANWINDISGLRSDPDMITVARSSQCPVVVMHMLGIPQTMQENPFYENVLADLLDYFEQRISELKENNINRIIIDPGIGFGKRLEDNLQIIRHIRLFKQFGYPVLLGTSRKSFIGMITGKPVNDRFAGTLGTVALSGFNGVAIHRTHDVAPVKDLLKIVNQIL